MARVPEPIRLDGGHTNTSFVVDGHVVRYHAPGKSEEQLAREARVLGRLDVPWVPRIVRSDAGARMFTLVPGAPGPRYLDRDVARMTAAMRRLGELHAMLAGEPANASPWHWIEQRLARVRARGLERLPPDTAAILESIERALVMPIPGAIHALHGDYHLGNLLWNGTTITGVVDFDDTDSGAALTETAMALFALARLPDEDRFGYDRELWDAGAAAYGTAIDPTLYELAFCGYQVLIHLDAAQRGLWSLVPGIGFWPCWNTLTASRETGAPPRR